MEEQLGIRLRIAPAFGEVRSMRSIPHALRGAAGALPQRPARRFPPPSAAAWRSAGSRLRPAQRPRPAARRLKALNDRKRMSLKTGRASGYRRITPRRYSPYRSGCRRAPGPPESLAGLATAPEFSSPTPPARRRTSPAGGAGRHRTGCAVRRGGCRRGFPCRAAISAAQGLLQLAGTAGRRWRQRWKRCP